MSYSTDAKLLVINMGIPSVDSLPKSEFIAKLRTLVNADERDIETICSHIELPKSRVSLSEFYKMLLYFDYLQGLIARHTLAAVASLLRQPWFAGFVKPADIATRLNGKRVGTFLVSFHDDYVGLFKLSVVSNKDQISHFFLYYNLFNRVRVVDDKSNPRVNCETIQDIIEKHKYSLFQNCAILDNRYGSDLKRILPVEEPAKPMTVDWTTEHSPLSSEVDCDNNNNNDTDIYQRSNKAPSVEHTVSKPAAATEYSFPQRSTELVLRAPPKPEPAHTAQPTDNAVYYGDLANFIFKTEADNAYRTRISWEEFVLRASEKLLDPTLMDIVPYTAYMNVLKPYLVDRLLSAVTKAKVEHFFKFFPQLTATKEVNPNKATTTIVEIAKLLSQEWFHGFIDANVAEARLFGRAPGTFLVRFSSSAQAHITVSLVGANGHGNYHYRFQIASTGLITPEGECKGWKDLKSFNSISELVSYYATEGNQIWDCGVSLLRFVSNSGYNV
jgi:hypothetical protein